MKVIKEQIAAVKVVLPNQELNMAKSYRALSFCVITKVDGQNIAYNALTGELTELSDSEARLFDFDEIKLDELSIPLAEKWFFVPVDHNDIQLAEEIRAFVKIFQKKDGIFSYTIFTTMDCNARCFYCYEMGRPRTPMSEETAREVVEFIDKNVSSKRKVKLSWFGGEPLYNQNVINIITDGLRKKDIEFKSHIITNGYLFDDKVVANAKEKWNIKRVQISLDGTEGI